MKCEICHQGPPNGPAVFRVNPKGVPGIWRCEAHLTTDQKNKLDGDVLKIVGIIEADNKEKEPQPTGWVDALTGRTIFLDDKQRNGKCPDCGSYSVISDQPSISRCLKCGWNDD